MRTPKNSSGTAKPVAYAKAVRVARSVSTFTLIQTAVPFLVAAVLGLGHIYLNFTKTDLVIQLTQLQAHKRKLMQEQGRLIREKESLADLNRLKSYAVQHLKMIEIEKPTKDILAVVSDSSKEKYLAPLKKSVSPVMIAQEENMTEKILRFVGSNKATASPIN